MLGIRDVSESDENGADSDEVVERLWLIQCKREKKVTPAKLEEYVDEVLTGQVDPIYGVIFAAPTDFSKKSRDRFINNIRAHDVQEFRLWGRAELEDLLFQPKNDHLLFAYFNVSLRLHRRTTQALLRSKLAIKRKAIKVLGAGEYGHCTVLLRDPNEERYPFIDDIPDFQTRPSWRVYDFVGHYFGGLKFAQAKYFAYLADDKKHFDFAAQHNDSRPYNDPWAENQPSQDIRHAIHDFWMAIPEENRAFLEVINLLPYENILAIDEDGDEYFRGPQVFAPFVGERGPFSGVQFVSLRTSGASSIEIYPDKANRIEHFPEEMRNSSPCRMGRA